MVPLIESARNVSELRRPCASDDACFHKKTPGTINRGFYLVNDSNVLVLSIYLSK
jgi:hypothetical protein